MSRNYDCNSWYPKKLNDRIEQVHQAQRYAVFIKIYVVPMLQNYNCNSWYRNKLNDILQQVIINHESSLGVCSGAVGGGTALQAGWS